MPTLQLTPPLPIACPHSFGRNSPLLASALQHPTKILGSTSLSLQMEEMHPKPDLATVLGRSRQLCFQGAFRAALAELEPFITDVTLRDADRIHVYRTAARILIPFGYPQAASDFTSKALALSPSSLTHEEVIYLSVHDTYVNIVARGTACNDQTELQIGQAREWLASLELEDRLKLETVGSRLAKV